MIEKGIIQLTRKTYRTYLVKPSARTLVFCPDCSTNGHNAMIYQIIKDAPILMKAVRSVVGKHEEHLGHKVDYVKCDNGDYSIDLEKVIH